MNYEGFDPSTVPNHYGGMVVEAAQANNIDPAVLAGLIEQESLWDPGAVSSVGAQGLGQFMPDTAKEFGVDVTDPKSSIDGAARYLRYLIDYFGGDQTLALYAYNGGMGNIERYGGPIPGSAENEGYAPAVLDRATKYGYQGYVPGLNPAIQQ
jgi:soluble lytic murein transglycosylase-like protein